MIYLIFAILLSSSLNFVFKFAEKKEENNRKGLSFVNLSSSFVISLILSIRQPLFRVSWFKSFFNEYHTVLLKNEAFSLEASFGYAILVAILGGLVTFIAIYILQTSTAKNGPAMTVTFNKAGVVIPVLLSILVFHETPSPLQLGGILLAVFAIILIYLKKEALSLVTAKIFLLGTMFFGGFCDFVSKIYQNFGSAEGENIFLLYLYLFGAIIALLTMIKAKEKIHGHELRYGIASGVISQLGAKFLLRSLSYMSSFIVFSVYSVGTILIVNIVNLIFFKEKLLPRQYVAILLMITACIMLNL